MLLELAIGDAYGAGFEYADRGFVRRYNNLTGYVKHPRHQIKPGCYTDDTQMSLALAELIVGKVEWTPLNLADKFVEVFKRDKRQGYSAGFYRFLNGVNNGREFLAGIRSTSDKSGAAMRACPLGVLATIDEVIDKATIQAKLTHNTPDGIHAAIAAALLANYFVYRRGCRDNVADFLEQRVSGHWSEPWRGPVGSKGWMSVRAAITALQRADAMSSLLKHCVSFTGDVDSVAAIALAAAAHCPEIRQDLPLHLTNKLEDKAYGRQYLASLDKQLMALANS